MLKNQLSILPFVLHTKYTLESWHKAKLAVLENLVFFNMDPFSIEFTSWKAAHGEKNVKQIAS